jgi:ferritin-like metal-binding protein YciE
MIRPIAHTEIDEAMTTTTPTETFERELQKLYHAELEILDLHADLAAAAASEEVKALFADHEADTVEQIRRIERMFDALDEAPRARGSPVMEGILAEKNEIVSTDAPSALRDLDVLSTGMLNERFEITVLDRLLVLAAEVDLPREITTELGANRQEAKAALTKMEAIVERRRVE